jgi:HPt (histidine-containing phosphotransfer) domain-containing protein
MGAEPFEKETEQYFITLINDVYSHLSKNFDADIIEKLLQTAVVSIKSYLKDIKKNSMLEDRKELVNTFHAFQGMLVNLGLEKEAESARTIQQILKQETLQSAMPHIENFINKTTLFLKVLEKKIS